jgi:manganese/zinc/iron transport system substrate-binding protein
MGKWKFLVPLVGIIFFLGCQVAGKPESNASGKKRVLSTIAQIAYLVDEVGAGRVSSEILVRGEINPHSYELVKGDDEKIQGADLLFYNGLGLEHGRSVVTLLQSHPNALAVAEAIEESAPEKILWKGSTADPHLWMDVSLWARAVDPIAERLIALDPEGESEYRQRASLLKEKMMKAHEEIFQVLQAIPTEKRYLITSHDAFHYFTRSYLAQEGESSWEERFAAPEGLAPDGQLNPIDLKLIIDRCQAHRIEVLFPESSVSRDSIRKIVAAGKQMGLELRICSEALYGDSFQGSYLNAMKHNADAIAKGINP